MLKHKQPRGVRPVELKNLPDDQRYLAHYASGQLYGFIYFVISDPMALVKIGASNRWIGHRPDTDSRVLEVRKAIPFLPVTRTAFITPMSLQMSEPELHEHFEKYQVEIGGNFDPVGDNEWFQLTDTLKAFVDDVVLLMDDFDRLSEETEAYQLHEAQQTALGRELTMPMPAWPKIYPWRHLKDPAPSPSKKLTGFGPVFQ